MVVLGRLAVSSERGTPVVAKAKGNQAAIFRKQRLVFERNGSEALEIDLVAAFEHSSTILSCQHPLSCPLEHHPQQSHLDLQHARIRPKPLVVPHLDPKP